MAGSIAGLIGGSCPACKGSGKAQPGRPVEDPAGGGPGMGDNGTGAFDRHIDKRASASDRRTGGGKFAGESHNSASKMPDDQDVKHPAIEGAGGGASKRVAKEATNSTDPVRSMVSLVTNRCLAA